MFRPLKLWLCCLCLCAFASLIAGNSSDTVPPVITVQASDMNTVCNATSIGAFTTWFDNFGGTVATDNSGNVTLIPTLNFSDALDVLDANQGYSCGNESFVEIGWYAMDDCNNQSIDTSFASFYINDNFGPVFIQSPSFVSVVCSSTTQDSLNSWIENKAGAIVDDSCSDQDSIAFFRFIATDNFGNSIVGDFNTPVNVVLDPTLCYEFINVSFWVIDDCDNQTIESGQFAISDNSDPIWSAPILDKTVLCDSIAPDSIVAIDDCAGILTPSIQETTTQGSNPNNCDYYSYMITRQWTAVDPCGNDIQQSQVLTVIDTLAPQFDIQDTVYIDCTEILSADANYGPSNVIDNCSNVSIDFIDQMIGQGCDFIIERLWTLDDVCGNALSKLQVLIVSDSSDPFLINPARDTFVNCDDFLQITTLLNDWIITNGYSSVAESCNVLQSFQASPGTYDLNDPSTYPGILNTDFTNQNCDGSAQFLSSIAVDFVYHDGCGNAIVTQAEFGVNDPLPPNILNCPNDTIIGSTNQNCQALFTIELLEATDNCLVSTSPVVLMETKLVSSPDPGNQTVPVDSVLFRLGPANLFVNPANGNVNLEIELFNMDSGETTEFFIVKSEDGIALDSTPIFTECDNGSLTITDLTPAQINAWGSDGFIDFWLVPNLVGSGVFAINDICNGSSANMELTIDVDVQTGLQTAYSLNAVDTQFVAVNNFPFDITLPSGTHQLEYFFFDCGGNQASCIQQITIEDDIAPIITCPNDTLLTLPLDTCAMSYDLSFDFIVEDNCNLPELFSITQPSNPNEAFIGFLYNASLDTFLADDAFFSFENVPLIEQSESLAQLNIDLTGDINEDGEWYEIYGEGGTLLGTTELETSSDCGNSLTTFFISKTQYNEWVQDGQLFITAVAPNNASISGGGINNCAAIASGQDSDGISAISAQLVLFDGQVQYSVSGATSIASTLLYPNATDTIITLSAGSNIVEYLATDDFGNTGSCSYEVFIEDVQDPVVACNNFVAFIHPSGLIDYELSQDELITGSTDNCQIISYELSIDTLDCSMVGQDIDVTVTVKDMQGNQASCIAMVRIETAVLQPDFTVGVCQGDTLRLFANVPSVSVPNAYTFNWSGPNGFVSNLENPIIPNPSSANNGTYVLEVEGFSGCISMGTVEVIIQQLTTPEIFTNNLLECVGESLILSATDYSGTVTYKWYEGISPTGVLLQSTLEPNLVLMPSQGTHSYYVEVESPDCATLPSNSLTVDIVPMPTASVQDAFITLCEGDDLVIGTDDFDASYIYSWTGPNGYTSDLQLPPAIANVTELNQGLYQLVINNGACNSDTATTQVVIFNSPETPLISGEEILCEDASFLLSVNNITNADQYTWFLNGALFVTETDNNLSLNGATQALSGDWTVLIQEGLCASDTSAVFSVFVEEEFPVGASNSSNNGFVCEGDSVTVMASFIPNAEYIWEAPNGDMFPGREVTVLAQAGIYSVSVTTQSGCESTNTTTVFIDEIPIITALSNNSEACMDGMQAVQFFPTIIPAGNYNYDWTGPANFGSDQLNPIIDNASSSNNGIYTLVVTNGECVSEPEISEISITDIPDQAVLVTDALYCQGSDLIILTDTVDQATYLWSTPIGDITTTEPTLNIPGIQPSDEGDYTVIVNVNGCESISSEISFVEIQEQPNIPNAVSNSPVCEGDTLFFNVGQIMDATYQWEGPNGFASTERDPFLEDASMLLNGNYRVRILINDCPSEWRSLEVNVLEKPETPIFTEEVFSFCEDGANTEVCWTGDYSEEINFIVLLNGNTYLITTDSCFALNLADLTPGDANTLEVSAQSLNCDSESSSSATIDLNLIPSILAEAGQGDLLLCDEEETVLSSVHGPPDVEASWMALNSTIDIDPIDDVSVQLSNLPQGQSEIVLFYSSQSCTNYSSDTVSIFNLSNPIANNDSLFLSIDLAQAVFILDNDDFREEVSINILQEPLEGSYTIDNGIVSYTPNPLFPGEHVLVYEICYVDCPDLCSEASVIFEIEQTDICVVPTVITPNGDNINDALIIPCLSNNALPNNGLKIFNEWGDQLFESSPYQNDWQGTYNNDRLPVGTYYYILDLGDSSAPISGFIHLER